MAADGKKGITVKVDAALHAEITQYLQDHGMTMTEFVTLALQDELHPKIDEKEGKNHGENEDTGVSGAGKPGSSGLKIICTAIT